jgi:hypothetical protein
VNPAGIFDAEYLAAIVAAAPSTRSTPTWLRQMAERGRLYLWPRNRSFGGA